MSTLKVIGMAKMLENLIDLAAGGPEALGAALHAHGLEIMRDAKKMVPVDTGRLRSSGFVSAPMVKGNQPVVLVGFGTKYALAVHEAPGTLRGKGVERASGRGMYWDPSPDAQPKFLEKAVNQHSSEFSEHALSLLEKFLESGVGIQIVEDPSFQARS